jgi:hypothetical protein
MKFKKTLRCILLCGVANFLSAQSINIELGGGTSLGHSDSAGVIPSIGWQKKSGYPNITNSALSLSDGSSTGATITANGSGNLVTFGATTTDSNTTMFNSGLGITRLDNGGSTISVSGLGADFTENGYNVYLYFGSTTNYSTDAPYTLSFSDGATTYYAQVKENEATYSGTYLRATATIAETPTVSSNYVLFEGLTSANFAITVANILNTSTDSSAALTGMQIVAAAEPAPEPQPEPDS